MIFKGLTRHLIRLVSITALAMLTIVGALNSPVLRMLDTATAFQEKMKEDARKQIAEKGYYAANPDQAENDLKTLEAQTTGDSTTARAARDMFTVTHTFIDKVKASNDAEKACNFDVVTIASTDDIAHRRDLLMNLRVTQVDVVTYLQDFDTHCRDALAHDDFSPDFVDGVLAGARKSGHVDMLITLWQSKIKLTDDYVARLDYLGKSYGAWNVKDGKLVFTDSDGIVAYNGYIQALQNDVKAIGDEQKQIVQ